MSSWLLDLRISRNLFLVLCPGGASKEASGHVRGRPACGVVFYAFQHGFASKLATRT